MPKFKYISGFTLLELLIALGLLSFILTTSYLLLINQQQSYRTQQAVVQAQEIGRVALGILRDRIRLARGLGCMAWHSQLPVAIQAYSLPQWLPQQAQDLVHGYHANEDYWNPPLPSYLENHVRSNTDVLVVHHAYEQSANLVQAMSTKQAPLVVLDHLNLKVGDTLIIADCQQADILQISHLSQQNNAWWISHQPPYNKTSELSKNFGKEAQVSVLQNAIYYVGDTGRDTLKGKPIYALYQFVGQHQELIEGISDLQVQYGVDTNGDNAVDTTLNTPPTMEQGVVRSVMLMVETQSLLFDSLKQQWYLTVALRN